MKKRLCIVMSLLMIFCIPTVSLAKVKVNGYYRKNGTYVSSHYRSNPDKSKYNNYSYPGNYNPNKNSFTPYYSAYKHKKPTYKTPIYTTPTYTTDVPTYTTPYIPQYITPVYPNITYTKSKKTPTKWFYATNNTTPEYVDVAISLFDKYLKYKDNNRSNGVTNKKISAIAESVWKFSRDEELIKTIDNNYMFLETYSDNGLTCVYRDDDKIEFSHRILFSLTEEQYYDDVALLYDIIQVMYPDESDDCLDTLTKAIQSMKDTDKQVHVFSPKGDAIISIYVRDYGFDTSFTIFSN